MAYRFLAGNRTMAVHRKWSSSTVASEVARELYRSAGCAVPRVVRTGPGYIDFERVDGRPIGPEHLPDLARRLSRIEAELVQRPKTALEAFDCPSRVRAIAHSDARGGLLPPGEAVAAVRAAAGDTRSLYKDANVRNWVVTNDGTFVAVDFESVTRAPPGYDLAKLLVSAQMTWGPVESFETIVEERCATSRGTVVAVTEPEVAAWCEVHWLLTAKYLGRNGYAHAWPTVRPGIVRRWCVPTNREPC